MYTGENDEGLMECFFSEDISKTEYCQISLNEESQKAFAYAIKNQYWYQMYIDDLPIWGNYHNIILICWAY